MADVVAIARHVNATNWAAMVARTNANHGVIHAARNIGRFTGRRIVDFQNIVMRDNGRANTPFACGLDDCQIAFVFACEFPAASGRVFTADPATRVAIVRGIRADYIRTGHSAAWVGPYTSTRHGAAHFAFPTATTTDTNKS